MQAFNAPEWQEILVPDGSLLDSFFRGVAVYVGVLVICRIFSKRELGAIGFGDMLLVVLLSECVSQALTAEKKSVPNGLAAVTALLTCIFLTDWATYHFAWVRRMLQPGPVPLVTDGQPHHDNLRKELITEDELLAQLRLNGVDGYANVKSASLEAEGEVSVIEKKEGEADDVPPDFEAAMRQFQHAAQELQRVAKSLREGIRTK